MSSEVKKQPKEKQQKEKSTKEKEKQPRKKYEPKSSKKKTRLLEMEAAMREVWEKEKLYESNAPETYDEATKAKFLTTFPYPYMNGKLHLGHGFSSTKCEFKNRYMRLQGKNTLFPFSFHCTGMPICAAANKLKKELEDPSLPKDQTNILKAMKIPEEDIPKFADPVFWTKYFPPLARDDLTKMGYSVDWRRSFITTEINPYYDSFIRWQFNTLKAEGKLSYGKRHTIYSTIDGQPCADHDRDSGEGIMPQEYTLIKMEVLSPMPEALSKFEGQKVFLVAATMRPETMYGQTNCFILPDGEYGVYKMKNGDLFVCSERSAKNMAYQEMTEEPNKYPSLANIKGSELIGAALKAPLATYDKVYLLPMFHISMKKGTGVVTSCPSDAPDDWATLRDLQKKKELRAKFGIKDEWVNGFDPVPIIHTDAYGDLAAVTLCDTMKITSQNDTEKLRQAKDLAYLKGFNEGVMIIGMCKGEKVSVAKNKVKAHMIEQGTAVEYWEPFDTVVSRSGEECVVALCNQWCINYGETEWKDKVMKHVTSKDFTCYNEISYKCFLDTLDWLKEWACSRTFGLGSRLPWDTQFLIESLSDSTIYNAFYTISHLLQGGVPDGSVPGPLAIDPKDITDADWDYVFLHKPRAETSKIPEEKLAKMRHEFEYWYPVDMRCSGKDLIKNHLTMMLYNHAGIWKESNKMMPRSFFCNGYVMVDGEKMSKHLGNFYTMNEILEMFGADSTRLAFASSGDLLEDANVEIDIIDKAILKIFILEDWIEKQLALLPAGPLAPEDPNSIDLFDKFFLNDMIEFIELTQKAYENMRFRDVVKYAFHQFQGIKDEYLVFKKESKINWHYLLKYIEWQLILMTPIIPYMTDYCWRNFFLPKLKEIGQDKGKSPSVITERYPILEQKHDKLLGRMSSYLRNVKRNMRLGLEKANTGKKAGKGKKGNKKEETKEENNEEKKEDKKEEKKLAKCVIFVAKSFTEIQQKSLEALNKMTLNENNELQGDLVEVLRAIFDKNTLKNAMKFATYCVERAKEVGKEAFEIAMPFDEKDMLIKNLNFLELDIALSSVEIFDVADDCPYEQFKNSKAKANPGNPEIFFIA